MYTVSMTGFGKLDETYYSLLALLPLTTSIHKCCLGYDFRSDHCSYHKIMKHLYKHSHVLCTDRYKKYNLRKNFYYY